MDLTRDEWNVVLEMYALGMESIYEDATESEIEKVQTLFHKVRNMVNEYGTLHTRNDP